MKKFGLPSNNMANQDSISTSKFSNEGNNFFPLSENYIPQRLKKKASQLSSKSITTTVKFEYTISRNNSMKQNLLKNEKEIKRIASFSSGNILRTQSRILNSQKDEPILIKKEYTCRNKVFENLDMDKICGSSYRKIMKDKNNIDGIINSKGNNNDTEQINNNGKDDVKENIKVIKEYTINYDKKIFLEDEKEVKMKPRKKLGKENKKANPKNKKINQKNKKLNEENIKLLEEENKKINDENKYILTKADYYTDKYNIKNPNSNTKKQNLIIDKSQECEIMYIPKAKSEVKNKKKLNNEKHKKLKYLIGQKENIPFNIKTKSLNIKENKFNCENRRNPNLFLYDNLSYTKNKYREENNKTMNQAFLNKKLEFLSELNSPVNKCKINSKKKTNNFNLYNRYTKQLKKDKFNFNRYLTNKTISLMNRFGNSQNNKCIMPPNNLKNILFKEEAKYFDFY